MNDRFGRELKKLIDDEIARLTNDLVVGIAVTDYSTYRAYVGSINALKRVNDTYLDEAESNLNKR